MDLTSALRALRHHHLYPTDKRSVCLELSAISLTLALQIRQIDCDVKSQMLSGTSEEQ